LMTPSTNWKVFCIPDYRHSLSIRNPRSLIRIYMLCHPSLKDLNWKKYITCIK
jgi:hypothetical protein